MLQDRLARAPLAGFVNEGPSPYGRIGAVARRSSRAQSIAVSQ